MTAQPGTAGQAAHAAHYRAVANGHIRSAPVQYDQLGTMGECAWEDIARAAIDWWHSERDLEPPRTVTAAAAAQPAPGDAALRQVLKDHFLMTVVCDPDKKQDNPVCQCSRVHLGWHPSIGAAVDAWIDHVTEVLASAAPAAPAAAPGDERSRYERAALIDAVVKIRRACKDAAGNDLARQVLRIIGALPYITDAQPAPVADVPSDGAVATRFTPDDVIVLAFAPEVDPERAGSMTRELREASGLKVIAVAGIAAIGTRPAPVAAPGPPATALEER